MKCFVFFFFFFMPFVFFPQYFLILFKATLAIFECLSCISRSLIFCGDLIIFSFLLLYCFNTTFSPCFFCNFYNHFIYTHTHKNLFDEYFLFFIFVSLWFHTTQSHNFIFFISLLKLSFDFSCLSFSFKIAINSSWLISMSINPCDTKVSMLLSLLLVFYHAFSFLFLLHSVMFWLYLFLEKKIK